MAHLDDVQETAHQRAETDDGFAVCCSDGDLTFAATRTEAEEVLEEMESVRSSLNLMTDYEYEIVDLSASDTQSTQQATIRKARQALGRVIRGHEEAGVRVAVDRRYASSSEWDHVREYLPAYEQNDYAPTSPKTLRRQLESFWLDV